MEESLARTAKVSKAYRQTLGAIELPSNNATDILCQSLRTQAMLLPRALPLDLRRLNRASDISETVH